MFKDYMMRLGVVFVSALFVIYLVSLWVGNVTIVNTSFAGYNDTMYLLIAVMITYVSVAYGFYPLDLPRLKRTLFFIGAAMILIGHYILQDNPTTYVFFADLTKVIGVVLVILGPAGMLISQRVKNKRKAAKLEVIEV